MAKKEFDKPASLDAGEIVMVDAVESMEPTEEELAVAKHLESTPKGLDVSAEIINSLIRKGLAADFGEEGFARGFRYFVYFK